MRLICDFESIAMSRNPSLFHSVSIDHLLHAANMRRTSERTRSFIFCPTSKMSHDYGWRDSCAAGGVTDMVVGSGALLGFSVFKGIFSGHVSPDQTFKPPQRREDVVGRSNRKSSAVTLKRAWTKV